MPLLRGFSSDYRHPFGTKKLEWCRYATVNNFEDTFIRFDMIHERDRQTDGQTPHDGYSRAYA